MESPTDSGQNLALSLWIRKERQGTPQFRNKLIQFCCYNNRKKRSTKLLFQKYVLLILCRLHGPSSPPKSVRASKASPYKSLPSLSIKFWVMTSENYLKRSVQMAHLRLRDNLIWRLNLISNRGLMILNISNKIDWLGILPNRISKAPASRLWPLLRLSQRPFR